MDLGHFLLLLFGARMSSVASGSWQPVHALFSGTQTLSHFAQVSPSSRWAPGVWGASSSAHFVPNAKERRTSLLLSLALPPTGLWRGGNTCVETQLRPHLLHGAFLTSESSARTGHGLQRAGVQPTPVSRSGSLPRHYRQHGAAHWFSRGPGAP